MVIDTNLFIEHLRAKDKTSTALYALSENEDLYISAVTLYELYMGATSIEKINDVTSLPKTLSYCLSMKILLKVLPKSI